MSSQPMRIWRVIKAREGFAIGELVALIVDIGRAFVVLEGGMGEWFWLREVSLSDYEAIRKEFWNSVPGRREMELASL